MLAVAVYVELKERRIPNWLTLSGMALGLLIAYMNHLRWFRALWDCSWVLVISFIFYVFGGVGGGDAKLMGAAGALMGGQFNPVGAGLYGV